MSPTHQVRESAVGGISWERSGYDLSIGGILTCSVSRTTTFRQSGLGRYDRPGEDMSLGDTETLRSSRSSLMNSSSILQPVLQHPLSQRLVDVTGLGARAFSSILVAGRAVSPTRRFLPASKNSFDHQEYRLSAIPTRRQSPAMLSSPPCPSRTMRTFPSAECLRQVLRTACSAGSFLLTRTPRSFPRVLTADTAAHPRRRSSRGLRSAWENPATSSVSSPVFFQGTPSWLSA